MAGVSAGHGPPPAAATAGRPREDSMGQDEHGSQDAQDHREEQGAGEEQAGQDAQGHREEQGSREEQGASEGSRLTELYERMAASVREYVERAGTLSEETLERGLKEARELAQRLRTDYGEDIGKISEFIRRDWHEAIRLTREQTRRSFDFERIQIGLLGTLSRLAQQLGSQLESFADRVNQRLTYRTGEIAGAGTLACRQCEQQLTFEKATRIPPCPKCRGTVFRRSY